MIERMIYQPENIVHLKTGFEKLIHQKIDVEHIPGDSKRCEFAATHFNLTVCELHSISYAQMLGSFIKKANLVTCIINNEQAVFYLIPDKDSKG